MVYIRHFYSVDIFPISMSIHPKLSPSINRCPESVPMTAQPHAALNEPSLADAIVHIERSEALSRENRLHWTCSMRFVARALDRPPSLIPARWMAVRPRLEEMHPSQLGVTAKTFANHRANVRAALNLFCAEKNVPRRGTPLSEPWSVCGRRLTRVRNAEAAVALLPIFVGRWDLAGGSRRRGCRSLPRRLGKDRSKGARRAKPATACSRLERLLRDYLRDGPRNGSLSLRSDPLRAGPTGKLSPPDCATRLTPFSPRRRRGSFRCQEPARKSGRQRPAVSCVRNFRPSRAWRCERGVAIETLNSLSALLDPRLVEKVLEAIGSRTARRPGPTRSILLAISWPWPGRRARSIRPALNGSPGLQDALGSTSGAA